MTKTKPKAAVKKQPTAKKAPVKKAPAKRKTKAVARVAKAVATIPMNGQAAILALEKYIEQRQNILKFVHDSLVKDQDYGFTHSKAKKQEIWKSGCEKVIGWLQLATPKFFQDAEAWEMLGKPTGTVMLRCYLIRQANMPKVLADMKKHGLEYEELFYRQYAEAEGRGAASLDGKTIFDANACIKKCEIRCQKDAVLRLGLSGEFGQDEAEYAARREAAQKDIDRVEGTYEEPRRTIKPEEKANAETVEPVKNGSELEKLGKEAHRILDSGKINSAPMAKKFREIVERNIKNENVAGLKGAINTMNTSR